MRKYFILIISIFCFGLCVNAQTKIDMIEKLDIKEDIVLLENRIDELIKENPILSKMKGLKQFHIPLLNYLECKKEDFF